MIKLLKIILLLFCLQVSMAGAEEKPGLKPSPKDKCPVCGMFVAKYPDFIAGIQFKDGTRAFFDGAKDFFKCYFDLNKYNPTRKQSDIAAIWVTNYYDLTLINGFEAFYIVGSDIYGPMGRELIPFAKEGDALEFLKDHKGKSLLKFQEVTPAIIKTLD